MSFLYIATVLLKGKVASLATSLLATRYLTHLTRMSLKCGEWLLRDKILLRSLKDTRIRIIMFTRGRKVESLGIFQNLPYTYHALNRVAKTWACT